MQESRVLVVDDVEANRELMAQELEEEDFTVRTAESGEACLAIASQWAPECILLDIQMPGMDGIETCRRLKADPHTRHIPVLFVTANRADDATTVEALHAGGNDFLTKPYSPIILVARVLSQISIARAHAQLRKLAMRDELTGLYSRRFLFNAFNGVVKGGVRTGPGSVSCLMIDIDHFKQINDTKGHLEGDRVLRRVAQTIDATTRETDIVARFGGEEFIAVLPNTDLQGAQDVAEKIRKAVQEEGSVTVSVGVSSKPVPFAETIKEAGPDSVDSFVERLIRLADQGVYQAKEQGRNQVVTVCS